MKSHARTRRRSVAALAGAMAVLTAVAPAALAKSRDAVPIEVLSAHADTVSGGDALVGVTVPDKVKAKHFSVLRNGVDVTAAFKPDADDPSRLVGLVDGLDLGDNLLVARSQTRGIPDGVLHVNNHPITGPIFSGPQQAPYICRTAASGLGEPT